MSGSSRYRTWNSELNLFKMPSAVLASRLRPRANRLFKSINEEQRGTSYDRKIDA